MSTTEVNIKKGAFGRPVKAGDTIVKKHLPKVTKKGYHMFKLVKDHSSLKPKDNKTNEIVDNPYPPIYIIPNAGVSVNPASGETERWRYLYGYNSIWEKDQQNPKPTKQRLENADGKNDLIFTQGFLKVSPKDPAKLEAMMVQDIFDGIGDRQIQPVPFVYTLIDDAQEEIKMRNSADEAFEAESLARKATFEEMLAVAMALGIGIHDAEVDEEQIRTKFIFKAKSDPKLFMRVYNDPRVNIKFLVTKGLTDGSIVVNEGVLSHNGLAYLSLRADADIAEQVATLNIEGDEKAKQLYDTLKSLT